MAAKIISFWSNSDKNGYHIKKPNNFKSKFGVLNQV